MIHSISSFTSFVKSPGDAPCYMASCPQEILWEILQWIHELKDVTHLNQVCKGFYFINHHPLMNKLRIQVLSSTVCGISFNPTQNYTFKDYVQAVKIKAKTLKKVGVLENFLKLLQGTDKAKAEEYYKTLSYPMQLEYMKQLCAIHKEDKVLTGDDHGYGLVDFVTMNDIQSLASQKAVQNMISILLKRDVTEVT
jgi:hypothetical protein